MQVEDRRIDRVHAEVTPLPEEPEEGKEKPDKKAEKENSRAAKASDAETHGKQNNP